MTNLQSLMQQHRIKDFIIGRGRYKSYRPEDDAERWNHVIAWYSHASPMEQQYIANILVEMFESKIAAEQIPALIIGRVLLIPELRDKVIDATISDFDKLESRVQDTLLITAARYQVEKIMPFILNALLGRDKIANFITWSDALSQDEIATDYDLWRLRMLARFYEKQDAKTREEIRQQILSLSRRHKKVRTMMRSFLHSKGNKYPQFRQVINAYLQE